MKCDHAIAGLKTRNPFTDRGDDAGGLVAENARRGSRLYSIFFRSVWQIPHASTRTRISPGPIAGTSTGSTEIVLDPRYTAARIVPSPATPCIEPG
jgi:hypothetical protein